METLFENTWQATKVRVVLWVSILVCAAAIYGGWAIFQTYGLSPGDGGVLRPVAERAAFGAFVAGLGVAFAGGMMLFASLYATRLERDGNRVLIETLTPLGLGRKNYELDVSQIGESAYHHGRFDRHVFLAGRPGLLQRVDAPWISMRTAQRRFPFVFDLQAETINIGALTALAEGAVADWAADRG